MTAPRHGMRIAAVLLSLGLIVAAVLLFLPQDRRARSEPLPESQPEVVEAAPVDAWAPSWRHVGTESRVASGPSAPRRAPVGAMLAGRVVDDDDLPVAGATISVCEPRPASIAAPSPLIVQVATDGDGRFDAPNLDLPLCDVVAEAAGFGWRALKRVSLSAGRRTEVVIVLSPRPVRIGRVLSPTGGLVAGADVVIRFGAVAGFGIGKVQTVLRTSADDGTFEFNAAVEPGVVPMYLEARKSGVGAAYLRSSELDIGDRMIYVALQPTRELRISFVPDDGTPPPSGLAFMVREPGAFVFEGAGDGHGRAVVADFPRGSSTQISVTAPEWRPFPKLFGGLAFTDPLEISVPLTRKRAGDGSGQPGSVEGVVVDPAGRPLEGMTVDGIFHVPANQQATTDAKGRFRLSGVTPAKNCKVGARRGRGPMTWSSAFELAAGGLASDVRITVGVAPDLVVQVVGHDGLPAAGIVVLVADGEDASQTRETVSGATDSLGLVQFSGLAWERVAVSIDEARLPEGTRVADGFDGRIILSGFQGAPLVSIRLRREVILDGSLVVEGDPESPVGEGTVELASSGGKVTRFARCDARGGFRLRACSIFDYRVARFARVVRTPGADPEIEVYEPVGPGTLLPRIDNRIMMHRRP